MTLVRQKFTTSKRAQNWGIFTVDVQDDEVWKMLHRVDTAVSTAGLAVFMHDFVSPYFDDEITDRFAYEGDSASGHWLPLQMSTIRIRRALGYSDDEINERTGDLFNHVTTSRGWSMFNDMVVMDIPGAGSTMGTLLDKKLRTAQLGHTQGPSEMLPGAYTPPRPVLALDGGDLAAILMMAQVYVIQWMTGYIAPGINVGSAMP